MCLDAGLFIKAAQIHCTACTSVVDQIIILLEMFKSKDIWYFLDVTIYAVLYDRKELARLFQTQGSFSGKQHQYYISFLNMWISWFCHLCVCVWEREREREREREWRNESTLLYKGRRLKAYLHPAEPSPMLPKLQHRERDRHTHTAIAETEKDAESPVCTLEPPVIKTHTHTLARFPQTNPRPCYHFLSLHTFGNTSYSWMSAFSGREDSPDKIVLKSRGWKPKWLQCHLSYHNTKDVLILKRGWQTYGSL